MEINEGGLFARQDVCVLQDLTGLLRWVFEKLAFNKSNN